MDVIKELSKEIANHFNHGPGLLRLRDALRHVAEACDARASVLESLVDEDDEMASREKARFRDGMKRAQRALTSSATSPTLAPAGEEEAGEGIAGCPVMHGGHDH